jgi:tetratricopeptide (TPR) repeat protein
VSGSSQINRGPAAKDAPKQRMGCMKWPGIGRPFLVGSKKIHMKSRILLLSILVTFLLWPVSSPAEPRNPVFALTLPGLEWALEINAQGFDVEKRTLGPRDDSVYLFASSKETHLTLSAFLEKAPRKVTSKECRDFYWSGTKKTALKKEQIEMYDFGGMPIVEYMVPTAQGRETNQKNLFAYFARDNYCAYIHLSKIRFVSAERGRFNQILTSAKFNESYNPTALDLLEFGNLSLFRKDFQDAISYYGRALELDKHGKSLGRKGWALLVDQLGTAYGLAGDFIRAKETYEWAISQEPENPMFFYNLACAYAEMDEMEGALRNLRLAYQYKGKVWAGQEFPDPRFDSSFKKYLNNKIFLAELQKMK